MNEIKKQNLPIWSVILMAVLAALLLVLVTNNKSKKLTDSEITNLQKVVDNLYALDSYNHNVDKNNKLSSKEVSSLAYSILGMQEQPTQENIKSIINQYFGNEYEVDSIYPYDRIKNSQPLYTYEKETNEYVYNPSAILEGTGFKVFNRITDSYKIGNEYHLTVYKGYTVGEGMGPFVIYSTKNHNGDFPEITKELYSTDKLEITDEEKQSAFDNINKNELMKTKYIFKLENDNYILKSFKYVD